MRGRVMRELQPIVRALDAWIREANPVPRYAVKWKRAYVGVDGGVVRPV